MQLCVRLLTVNETGLWDELAAVSPQRSIFTQRWWMERVTDGGVRLLGCFAGERLLAGLPIWPVRTLGVTRLRQPPLTPHWGPLLRPGEGKARSRAGQEMHLLRALAEALGGWPDITLQWHHSLTNWLPFYWHGFTQTTRYTYRIPDLSDLARVEQACHEAVGQQRRRATRDGLRLVDHIDPAEVSRLNALAMLRKGTRSSAEIQRFWPELARDAAARSCLFVTGAVDAKGNLHSTQAIVWDDRSAYGILNGTDPAFRGYGSTVTLWRAIEYAAGMVPEYDFEGSTLETVEQFYRRFGGELTPYSLITRADSPRLNVARFLQRLRGGKKSAKKRVTEATAPQAVAA